QTSGKRYPFLTLPVSDWFVGSRIGQSMEFHTAGTVHELVDFYYGLGALINLYSHSSSDGSAGQAGGVASEYVKYTMNTNLHPRLWSANAASVYAWWLQRSNAQVSASYTTNGNQSVITLSITGAQDTNTAVEILAPSSAYS